MLLLDTHSLRDGHVVALPIRHRFRPGVDLIARGAVLNDRIIRKLQRLAAPAVWVRCEAMDFLDGRITDRAVQCRDNIYGAMTRDFAPPRTTTVGLGRFTHYCELVNEWIIELVVAQRADLAVRTAELMPAAGDLFAHSVNVAHLALNVALRLTGYVIHQRRSAGSTAAADLTNLGVGAILHDLGKLQMPSTLNCHEPLDDAPSRTYREHPRRGLKLINERAGATARAVVLHHHQRMDGTGFPDMAAVTHKRRRGALTGEDIHIFPRLVAVCDTFEHLRRDESGRPRPTIAALKDLADERLAGRFDPVILRALLTHVPPFDLGMAVRLSNGRLAGVARLNLQLPCRPTVRLLDVEDPDERDINLAHHPGLHVTEALGVNVRPWLFERSLAASIPDPEPVGTPTA